MDYDKELQFLVNGFSDFTKAVNENFREYKHLVFVHNSVIDSLMYFITRNELNPRGVLKEYDVDIKWNLENKIQYYLYHDLIIYPQHQQISSLLDYFINFKKLKNEEKDEMLISMKYSWISIFQILNYNADSGEVIIDDVINHQKYKLIDNYLGHDDKNDFLLLRLGIFRKSYYRTALIMKYPQNQIMTNWLDNNKKLFQQKYQGEALLKAYLFYESMEK